ncbi:MAG: right-handed parallel beta-helix repeat-containing protein [Candidatus Eisenbacteria sp.]|nr:right-handed parallel beta-helix repeat-containing protein [Candidatus Eisenbacteria bacterium]
MRICAILTLVAVAAITLPTHATMHTVDVNGGGDFENIWGAITASVSGDTILVAPGTYAGPENRDMNPAGKNIVFLAEGGGRIPVIIDCEGQSRAFDFSSGENDSTLVRGFTIINGDDSAGGGFRAFTASPTIEDCTFLDCGSNSNGGALYLYQSTSAVSGCIFRGNTGSDRGGAVCTYQTAATFTWCLFDENMVANPNPPGSSGGAFFITSSSDHIEFCTLVENDLDQIVVNGSDADVRIANCVIANSPSGAPVAIISSGVAMATHCVVFGNAAGDSLECGHVSNIYHDPLFCDDLADDYTLCDDSFAVYYNNMWGEPIGAYDSGCEPCGTPVEEATWGAVKALFR